MTDARYGSGRWKKRRLLQLAHYPLCEFCREQGRITAATVVDHVKPHRGDDHEFWHGRLQSLCDTCHNAVKQSLERTGRRRGCDVHGRPLDPSRRWTSVEPVQAPGPKKSAGFLLRGEAASPTTTGNLACRQIHTSGAKVPEAAPFTMRIEDDDAA